MKRLKQKASYMSGWGMLCLYLPGPTSAGCTHFEHPCYNSRSQKCSCMVLPRCLSSHFLPEFVGEFSGNIREGSLQALCTKEVAMIGPVVEIGVMKLISHFRTHHISVSTS